MATSISGIHGHLLEVTVIGCSKLKDTEWISRQDPYVCLEYASSKFRTRTHTDGGKNPTFQEKFVISLIEGLRELNVAVWNSNSVTYDDFIGSGKVQLQKVLSQGYDDSPYTIHTKTNRYAGEVRLIMHYADANSQKPPKNFAPSAPPYAASPALAQSAYSFLPPASYPPQSSNSPYLSPSSSFPYPPPSSASAYPPPSSASPYPQPSSASLYPPPSSASLYPPPSSTYNQSYYSYQPDSASYPGSTYPPPHTSAYPPQPYPPPSAYPPVPYPPPAQSSYHYPPGPSYPGTYPSPY